VFWVEVFAVFVVCHLVGDYLLQTEFQAANKRGGLGANPVARRALVAHVAMYALAFVPALVWVGAQRSAAGAVALGALIAIPHLIQDDGRPVSAYLRTVKRTDADIHSAIFTSVDQSFHVLALFGTALLAAA
jgi:hypothetical protein